MSRDACGGCDRRDACAELFSGLFSRRERRPRWRSPDSRSSLRGVFAGLVCELVRNIEARGANAPRRAPVGATPFRSEVERHLEPLLSDGPIGIDAVARALGLSRQTLYRRLRAEGATFGEVLEGLRRRLALKLIRDEGVAVKEAAWRLGFSDPAAFSRAFKRWTGRSPREMRPGQPG
jgi:AraC-like DNA-binding protein